MSGKTPRVDAWTLIDTPLGWDHRGVLAQRLADAEQRRQHAEAGAAAAAYEAEVARWQQRRTANRRAVRIATALASVRQQPAGAWDRLRAAFDAVDVGPPPTPTATALAGMDDPIEVPDHADPEALVDAGERADTEVEHPHLRVLHLGVGARFARQATHTIIDPDRWREQVAAGADLLLIEPDEADWDPLDGQLPALLDAARAAGAVTVRIHPPDVAAGGLAAAARSAAGVAPPSGPGTADLELTEGPDGDLAASVDTHRFNPVGWDPAPPDPVVAALGVTAPDADVVELLARLDPPALALQPPDLTIPDAFARRRRVRTPEIHARAMHRAGVLVDHASFHAGRTDRHRTWAAALTCGTPVLALDPGDEPLPTGVLGVERGELTDVVHRFLTDPDHRERHSITARREALTDLSRTAAFRRLCELAGIPLPRPPRTSIVLSTHRPDFLEHALASVARQTQPDLDLTLVLHGDAFDDADPPARGVDLHAVVRAPSSWLLGDCLNAGVDRAEGELITKMDDDDHYGPHHLRDLVLAQAYSGADVVGKRIEFVHLADRDLTVRRTGSRPERDRPHVGGPTILALGSTLRRLRFLRLPNRVDSTLYERVLADGGRVYRTHSRDLILQRHGGGHAWERADTEFLDEAVTTSPGCDIALASSDPTD